MKSTEANDDIARLESEMENCDIKLPHIDTLAELRSQHSALLQRDVAGEETPKPSTKELLGFLIAAQKLGRLLDEYDDRETAQSIMDFWIPALLSQAPHIADVARPFALEPFDASIARRNKSQIHLHRSEAIKIARRAEKMFSVTQEEQAHASVDSSIFNYLNALKFYDSGIVGRNKKASIIESLLLRFVRLKEKSTEVYAVPLDRSDSIFQKPDAEDILNNLIRAGVIRQQETTDSSLPSYILAHNTLLTNWSLLVSVIAKRRAFRQLAHGWNDGCRQPQALLRGGTQLQEASDYPQLDDVEQDFVIASRHAVKRHQYHMRLVVFTTVVFLLAFLVFFLLKDNSKLAKDRDALKAQISHIQTEIKVLEKDKEKLEMDKIDLLNTAKDLEQYRDQLKAENKDLEERSDKIKEKLKLAMTKKSQLLSINEQLEVLPNIPESLKELLKHATKSDDVIKPNIRPNVEIFIPRVSDKRVMAKANEYADALRKAGFELPAGMPLPRKNIHVDGRPSEVRYFYKTERDLDLAKAVRAQLINAGILSSNIKLAPPPKNDISAPSQFIQISLTNTAFPILFDQADKSGADVEHGVKPAKPATKGIVKPAKPATKGAFKPAKPATKGAFKPAKPATKGIVKPAKPATKGAVKPAKPATKGAVKPATISESIAIHPTMH